MPFEPVGLGLFRKMPCGKFGGVSMYSGNPIADFDAYDREQSKRLAELPECRECGYPIQDEEAYYIDGEWICLECMEEYKKPVY